MDTFHDYVSTKLKFPTYYRHNFDAFWDCLLEMVPGTIIRVEGLSDFRNNLPDAYEKLITCIIDYREEYGQIVFELFEEKPKNEV